MQYKPFNEITFGKIRSDTIKQMKTMPKDFYLAIFIE